MPQPLPNLHHLELFYHVARSGGIMAAVRNMPYGIQQPAVSSQIALLESQLGARLFQRRPFQLTEAGRQLYEFCAPFFGKLSEVTHQISGKVNRHLRIAAPTTIIRNHLPAVLVKIRKACPDLELTLHDADQQKVMQLLECEEVDLAIAEMEGKAPSGVHHETLVSVPLVLLLPPGMARPRGSWTAMVHSQPLIRTSSSTAMARIFHDYLHSNSLAWPARIEVGALDLVHSYVAQGFGVGLGVKTPNQQLPKGVTALELKGVPQLQVAGFWRGKPTELVRQLLSILRNDATQNHVR